MTGVQTCALPICIGWIDPAIARLVFSNLQRPEKQIISTPEIKKSTNSYGLTERELDALELSVPVLLPS